MGSFEFKNEFDSNFPKLLEHLSAICNRILDEVGLYFDHGNARIPVQLTDNLEVYIRIKSNDQQIPYNRLSAGIRNYIFKLGHIASPVLYPTSEDFHNRIWLKKEFSSINRIMMRQKFN